MIQNERNNSAILTGRSRHSLLFLSILALLLGSIAFGQDAHDLVLGNLIQFNDNGAWCWYQDERAVVDVAGNKLIVGSDASGLGVGGGDRNGQVEGVIFDMKSGQSTRYVFRKAGCDDHNAPGLLVRPDDKYLVVYADHYDTASRYRIFDGAQWSEELRFDWNTIPGGTDFATTYSNLYYLSAEDKIYNFVRCYAKSPNMLVSADQGDTWSYGGLLTQPDASIGYVNGYFKYSGNGIDRIDFVGTEHHPRDYNTSIYHGFIKNGQSFKSDGTLMDSTINDKTAPKPGDFTQVFTANTMVNGIKMTRCWTIELQTYADGTVATIFKARANDSEKDHRFFYARYDGTRWTTTYLGKAGTKMYASEQDYIGLGALHPDNPDVLYFSVPFDPRDDSDLKVREIFKGVTSDHGATWSWTPITRKSVRDNFRPIVPAWDDTNTALLWWRGTYTSAQMFDAAVVGLIDRSAEQIQKMQYVDASAANTTLASGEALVTTGPDANSGAGDGMWHERTGFGNGNSVLTSSEVNGENAPTLKTRVLPANAGTYDIWVNFWGNPASDWRIKAGLAADRLQIFRSTACKQVETGDHESPIVLKGSGSTFLYQGYLGRVQMGAGVGIEVYVDDEAVPAGQINLLAGDKVRSWFDGVSYAGVRSATQVTEKEPHPVSFNLLQNYPNPFNPATTIAFSLEHDEMVKLTVYNLQGRSLATLVDGKMNAGQHHIVWNAANLPSGIYLCKLSTESGTQLLMMTLLK